MDTQPLIYPYRPTMSGRPEPSGPTATNTDAPSTGGDPIPGPAGPDMTAMLAAAQARASAQSEMASADALAALTAAQASLPPASAEAAAGAKPRYKKRTKKYNNFNIFFMLERQLLLQSRGGGINAIEKPIDITNHPLVKHKELHLPPLCRRYNHLPLTKNWFLELLAHQNKKRPHRKSHGLIPFKELAQTVAKNYKEIDDDTQSFVNEVAERLGWHCEEAEAIDSRLRREKEEEDRKNGIVPEGKKRKEAPVVSHGSVKRDPALSREDAATVRQLMGMKGTTPPGGASPTRGPLPGAGFPAAMHLGYPSLAHAHAAAHHHPYGTHPMAAGLGGHPGMGGHPSVPPQGASRDVESDHALQLELARAMTARVESERRIHLLKDQMTMRAAAQRDPMAAAHHGGPTPVISPNVLRSLPPGYERYLSLLGPPPHGGAAPRNTPLAAREAMAAPSDAKDPTQTPEMARLEKDLLREALLRKLIPPTPQSAPAATSQRPTMADVDARLAQLGYPLNKDGNRAEGAGLKKRARYSPINATPARTAEDLKAEAIRAEMEKELLEREAGKRARSASLTEVDRDIDFYQGLLSARQQQGAGSAAAAGPDALQAAALRGDPMAAAAARDKAARDLALYDALARGGGAGGAAAHQGHPAMRGAYGSMPPPSLRTTVSDAPAAVAAAEGEQDKTKDKQALLEMVRAASSKSQFADLSYNDIMDVWKEMNKGKDGTKREEGEAKKD